MRSIRNLRVVGFAISAAVSLALTSCGSPSGDPTSVPNDMGSLPVIDVPGSRAHAYASLDEIAAVSSALVVASPTGVQSSKALPPAHGGTSTSAPTTVVQMRVSDVVSGVVTAEVIDVVSPGTDSATGKPALLGGGPFLMYLAPAMYDANAPAGGYVITGGPAGVYGFTGVPGEFGRIDGASPKLPERVTDVASLPGVTRTAAELLAHGPS